MLSLLLAMSITSSIPAAVEKTLAQLPDEDRQAIRLAEVEARLANIEKVGDATSSCVKSAFMFTGGDLTTTAASIKFCEGCGESNPMGLSPEARMGLKIAQLGFQIDQCYRAAKQGKTAVTTLTWINRIVQGFFILNNSLNAATGKPLIKWGK